MTLDDWVAHGWIKEHTATPEEIGKLFDIVHRETTDAELCFAIEFVAQRLAVDERHHIIKERISPVRTRWHSGRPGRR